jgi:hypothetical protein
MLTKSGSALIARLLAQGAYTLGVGVGDSTHPESTVHTALGSDGILGSCWYKEADPTFPAITDNGLVIQASFDPGEANFDWREWCVFAVQGKIARHYELAKTGITPVLLNRRFPSVPMHSRPKTRELNTTWVLRFPLTFHYQS